jgi:hypothetical protein
MTPEQNAMAVSLKEYFETRLQSLDKATAVAQASMEKRLEGMNEFRDTLRDQAAQLVSRHEFASIIDKLNSEIQSLREFQVAVESKASQNSVLFVAALSVVGILISLAGLFWKR